MKKFIRKIVAISLSAMLLCSLCVTFAYAEESENNPTIAAIDNDLIAFVQSILPDILEFHGIDSLDSRNAVVVGNQIPTYGLTNGVVSAADYETYPLFINGKVFSIIRKCTSLDGAVSYNCKMDAREIPNIDMSEGALVYLDNTLHLVNPGLSESVSSAHNDLSQISAAAVNSIEYAAISPQNGTPISLSTTAILSNVEEDEILVDYIRNATQAQTPNCCTGLCWAACFASLANEFGNGSYATAREYHDDVDCTNYNQDYITYTPIYLNNSGVSTGTFNANGLTYNMMKNFINAGCVALIHVWNGGSTSHFVIGYGYYKNSNYINNLKYMDPNDGYCNTTIPSSGRLSLPVNNITCTEHQFLRCY